MSTPGASQSVRPSVERGAAPPPCPGDLLLATFNELRDELVSTLLLLRTRVHPLLLMAAGAVLGLAGLA